ncbi:MAG: cob(I)yrinic acid a,c-diamide adenosyltransferase [Candidatus Zixiibacteriota bacterium]
MATSARRYIQIYTGNGKGKTTAAIGQAVRAAGCGLRTLIIMFMKEFPYSEVKALKHLSQWITVEQYGNDEFVLRKQPPSEEDRGIAQKALQRARQAMSEGEYDVVVLDEICVAVYFGLLTAEDVVPLFDEKPDNVELILTGRYCPSEWIERADLVTQMEEVKHYYQQGVSARKGFES